MSTRKKSHSVSHQEAIEAIRVISSLATAIPPSYPPFSYGKPPGNVKMTPGNAIPALAVWLFLVTNPDYLDVLDGTQGADPSYVPVAKIAEQTNLTEACVQQILDQYVASGTLQSFRDVAQAFQNYARIALYDITNCPGNADAILQLARQGAAVDPEATQPIPS